MSATIRSLSIVCLTLALAPTRGGMLGLPQAAADPSDSQPPVVAPPQNGIWKVVMRVMDTSGHQLTSFDAGQMVRIEVAVTNTGSKMEVLTRPRTPEQMGLASVWVRQRRTVGYHDVSSLVADHLPGDHAPGSLSGVPILFFPGETMTWTHWWETRDYRHYGRPLPPGTYEIGLEMHEMTGVDLPTPPPVTITLVSHQLQDVVVISGEATKGGTIGFDVGTDGPHGERKQTHGIERVEASMARGQTALDAARALAASLPGDYTGAIISLPGGDVKLQVQGPPDALVHRSVELSHVRSNDPALRIRVEMLVPADGVVDPGTTGASVASPRDALGIIDRLTGLGR